MAWNWYTLDGGYLYQHQAANPFDVLGSSYVGVSNVQIDSQARSVEVSADGTRIFYFTSTQGNIHWRDMATPWDITTLGSNTFVYLGSTSYHPYTYNCFRFNPDGTRMILRDSAVSTSFRQWDLSTPWDISSRGSVQSGSYPATAYLIGPHIDPDGGRMYLNTAIDVDEATELSFTTPWDVTAGFSLVEKDEPALGGYTGRGFRLSNDGNQAFAIQTTDDIDVFDLSTAWDISSASYAGTYSGHPGSEPQEIIFSLATSTQQLGWGRLPIGG